MLRTLTAVTAFFALAASASAQFSPVTIAVDTAGNGVLETSEDAAIVPSWRNPGPILMCAQGTTLSNFTGPAGPAYAILDGAGSYGCMLPQSPPIACIDCYAVRVTAAARPTLHWDATVFEALGGAGPFKTWTLHVGATFTDVATTSPYYRFVETVVHRNVTGGCSASAYCPGNSVTRDQMAVFVLLSKEPPGYAPPACGAPMFADVPASSPYCRWIEELARRGVAAGCGGGNYCPGGAVTREQMAVFVLRTLDPALSPPACGTPMFADVPASSPFCRWIEELARRGIATGCGGGNYCPAAIVNREQMSVFLTATFGLVLYGV